MNSSSLFIFFPEKKRIELAYYTTNRKKPPHSQSMRLHTKENATGSPAHDRLVPLPYWFRNLFLLSKTHADDIDVVVVSQYADWKRNFLVSYRLTNYKLNFFLSFYATTTQPYNSSSTVVVVVLLYGTGYAQNLPVSDLPLTVLDSQTHDCPMKF